MAARREIRGNKTKNDVVRTRLDSRQCLIFADLPLQHPLSFAIYRY